MEEESQGTDDFNNPFDNSSFGQGMDAEQQQKLEEF